MHPLDWMTSAGFGDTKVIHWYASLVLRSGVIQVLMEVLALDISIARN